jgi:L-amino acid N-acyltransferase YncA
VAAPDWLIRPLRAADAPGVVDLLAEVAREGRWIATEWPFDEASVARRFADEILELRLLGWVADARGVLLGNLMVHDPSRVEPEFGMLVTATHRGRGIGRALLEQAVAWGAAQHKTALRLRVFPHNEAALTLYRAGGFVELGVERASVPRRGGPPWDAIVMRRELSAAP